MRHIPYFYMNTPDLMVETHAVDHLDWFTSSLSKSPETDEEKQAAKRRIEEASEDYDQLVPPYMRMFFLFCFLFPYSQIPSLVGTILRLFPFLSTQVQIITETGPTHALQWCSPLADPGDATRS